MCKEYSVNSMEIMKFMALRLQRHRKFLEEMYNEFGQI